MIHCAASQGATSSVQALLADGRVHPDAQDRVGRTALHWAAGQGHLETVVALLTTKLKASIDAGSRCNASPLMLAALGGHVDTVRYLLHAGAGAPIGYDGGPHGHAEWRASALHYAASSGHAGVVTTLLAAGFRRDQHDGAGLTPAEISARSRHPCSPAVTRLLLDKDGGGKLVHDYVNMVGEDVDIVRGLALGGAFLDWQDPQHKRTPLHHAVHFQHFQVIKILLQAGANPNLPNCHGRTPLHEVTLKGCMVGAAELLAAGADTTILCHAGRTTLHLAVAFNEIGVMRLLLGTSRAAIEIRDTNLGITPLAWAARLGRTPMLRVLLAAGADVESRSFAGLTPLHWACRASSLESIESLLQAGADLDTVDVLGADTSSVIGLGDPVGFTGRHSPHFTPEAIRKRQQPVDSPAANRIRSALRRARRDRVWRRRGWLVVLASRRADGALSEGVVATKRLALSVSPIVLKTELVVTRTEAGYTDRNVCQQPVVWKEEREDRDGWTRFYGGADGGCRNVPVSGPEQHGNAIRSGTMSLSDESREGVDGGFPGPAVCCFQSGSSWLGGETERLDDVTDSWAEQGLIEALLAVEGMERGVFRTVLSFI